MNRQVTIQLETPMFDYISTIAEENNETVATFISNYLIRTMLFPKDLGKESLADLKAKKKATLQSLRGILSDSNLSDEEAIDEYLTEKYNL